MSQISLKSLLLAARPKTLPAAVVPVWLGCVLAWKLTGTVHLWLAMCTFMGAVCIQVATNLFNDVIDAKKGADTERRLGPQRVTASGLLSPGAVTWLAIGFNVLAMGFGLPLVMQHGWPILAIGLPSLFLTYGYTGGPLPLAYRGLGELFVLLFFGFVAVCGTVFVQTGLWPHEALLLGGQVGLLSCVLISINNLRDREEDLSTGKKTLAARFGRKFAIGLIVAEIIGTLLLGLAWKWTLLPNLVFASVGVILFGRYICRGVVNSPPGPGLNKLLAVAGLQLVVFAVGIHLLAVY